MRMHWEGEHPLDALNTLMDVLAFLDFAVRGRSTMNSAGDETEMEGLGSLLLACRETVRYVAGQLEETHHRAA